VTQRALAAATESRRGCNTFFGEGPIAHVANQGKVATIGGIVNGTTEGVFTFNFQYPFVTGGNYVIYETTDGRHMDRVRAGTYTLVHAATAPAAGEPSVLVGRQP
jgi:hypothetical protein